MPTPSLSVNLPWDTLAAQASAFQGLNGDPNVAIGKLGDAYSNAYTGALDINKNLYSGIQTGYDKLRGTVDSQYQDIVKGYQSLYGDVLGRIAGTNSSDIQDINTQYGALSGKATQDMVSRGLGNSTVQQNMQRAIALDQARARTASQERFAQLGAGYANQIGQAGLQAQQQGIQTGANLGTDQLHWLNTVQAPYPNAGMYGQLAQMYGAQIEAEKLKKDMAARNSGFGLRGMPSGGGGGGTGGYRPPPMLNPGTLYQPSQPFLGGYSPPPMPNYGGFGDGWMTGNQEFDTGEYQQAMGALGGGAIGALGYGGFGGEAYGYPMPADPYADMGQWDTLGWEG